MKGIVSYITNLYFRLSFLRQALWVLLITIVFTMGALIFFQSKDVTTKPVGWEKSFYISTNKISPEKINVSSKGNYIVIVYEGKRGNSSGIYASISFNGGRSFLLPVKIADVSPRVNVNPYVAVSSGGKLSVFWHDFVEADAAARIFFSNSADFGANWSKPQQVYIGYQLEMLPRVFFDHRNYLHLFFHGFQGGSFNLYHAVSSDGKKFEITGPLMELTKDMRGAFFPSIHMSYKSIYMVWQGKVGDFSDDLFFMKSENYGYDWSRPRKITESKANDASPSIIFHDDNLYVVYRNNDNKNWEIKMIRGLNYGDIWETKPLTISKTNANCYSPDISLSKNNLYIVWYDNREKLTNIFSRKYIIKDGSLTNEVKLSGGRSNSKNPISISTGSRVMVFWKEGTRLAAKSNDVYVAPPVVYSYTHPEGRWSRKPVAVIQWRPPDDESGIIGYASIIKKPSKSDRFIDINPNIINVKANITRKIIPQLDDGITYFHIRAVDAAGNFSRTVHFPLRVSANPLPAPVVVSNTHPLGKAGKSNAPQFNWAVSDTVRLKGFAYNISKDVIRSPDKFTTSFNIKFEDLEEGKYFFTLSAIDKTNMRSNPAVYPFIIGRSGKIDPDYLTRIAKEEVKIEERARLPLVPVVEVKFPFDVSKVFDRNSFKAIITTKNINKKNIVGYSVLIDRELKEPADRINLKSSIMNVEKLKDGKYFVSVKCRYYRVAGGRKKYFWTEPFTSEIKIKLFVEKSPVEYYGQDLIQRISKKAVIVTVILASLIFAIMSVGFGTKIVFFYRLVLFKARVFFRLIF